MSENKDVVKRFIALADCALSSKLALGLHHVHSQLDYLAASSTRARISERRIIIEQIIGRHIPHTVSCIGCSDLSARVDMVSHKFYSTCSNNHRYALCQVEYIPINSVIAVECCWCSSVYCTPDPDISLCRFCRIGITQRA